MNIRSIFFATTILWTAAMYAEGAHLCPVQIRTSATAASRSSIAAMSADSLEAWTDGMIPYYLQVWITNPRSPNYHNFDYDYGDGQSFATYTLYNESETSGNAYYADYANSIVEREVSLIEKYWPRERPLSMQYGPSLTAGPVFSNTYQEIYNMITDVPALIDGALHYSGDDTSIPDTCVPYLETVALQLGTLCLNTNTLAAFAELSGYPTMAVLGEIGSTMWDIYEFTGDSQFYDLGVSYDDLLEKNYWCNSCKLYSGSGTNSMWIDPYQQFAALELTANGYEHTGDTRLKDHSVSTIQKISTNTYSRWYVCPNHPDCAAYGDRKYKDTTGYYWSFALSVNNLAAQALLHWSQLIPGTDYKTRAGEILSFDYNHLYNTSTGVTMHDCQIFDNGAPTTVATIWCCGCNFYLCEIVDYYHALESP